MKVFYIDFTFEKLKNYIWKSFLFRLPNGVAWPGTRFINIFTRHPDVLSRRLLTASISVCQLYIKIWTNWHKRGWCASMALENLRVGAGLFNWPLMKMRIFSVGISVIDDHFRIIAANLRLDEIAHQKYPHPHCNNMKEMGNFLAADLENFLRQHRTIPALRLKHRSGSCGTASALPKCSIRHPVLSALLA